MAPTMLPALVKLTNQSESVHTTATSGTSPSILLMDDMWALVDTSKLLVAEFLLLVVAEF
jgi:hypothetical protein